MKVTALALGLMLIALPAVAQDAKLKTQDAKGKAQARDNYDQLLQEYLASARATAAAAATAPAPAGDSWMSGLFGDLRARHVNDLVTIHVVESATALGSADAALAKDSSASASVTSLFGLESKYPGFLDPSALASLGANTDFKGSGSTTRSASLSAVMTARVAEVLPNGDLAVEGIRELDINGDRQIIVLTGIVRTADIGPGNVVPSTAIGQMRIRYFGRGLIKDNLNPGILVRILNKIF